MARTYARRHILRLLASCGLLAGCSFSLPGQAPPLTGGIIFSDGTRLWHVDPDAPTGQAALREFFGTGGQGTIADPAWSPDGTLIAYSYTPPPDASKTYGSDIYVISNNGSNPRAVFTHDVDGGLARAPAWAPDGTAIYYSYSFSRQAAPQRTVMVQQIERIDVASGARTVIVNDADLPTLSPDGQQLAFIRYPTGDPAAPSLWLAQADGSAARQLVPGEPFLSLWAPRFSPDGRSILFTGASREAATPRHKVNLARAGAGFWEPPPVAAHGFPGDLWLYDLTTGKPEMLAELSADDLYAAWGPTGQRVALLSGAGIHALDISDGTLQQLSPTPGYGAIDWARPPSGQEATAERPR